MNYVPANIPQELTRLNQWVVWGVEKENLKKPFKPTSMKPAKAGDPSTWSNFFEASNRVKAGQAQGVGFEFNNNGIYGIDLDHVLNNGQLTPEGQEIVDCLNSYTEISPSGDGIHIFVKADGVELEKHKVKLSASTIIEIYCKERYFTVTGNVYGELKPIESRTDELQAVYDKYLKPEPDEPQRPKAAQNVNVSDFQTDNDYLNTGLQKDQKFIDLWNGDRPNGNESADDQALFNKLAYWCNGNSSLMESAFLSSPHYTQKDDSHKKKCNRADYITRTANRAVKDLKSTAQESHTMFIEKRGAVSPGKVHHIKKPEKEPPKKESNFVNPLDNPGRYSFDDIGMGYLFADTFKNVSRYVPEAKSWYYYNGKVWRQDIDGLKVAQQGKDLADFLLKCAFEIKDMTQRTEFLKFVGKVTSNKGRKTMIEEARSVYPVNITDFDKDPYIFNCLNCTLDLRNYKMRPHRASDLLSKISNVVFDKNARCERWKTFVNEIMKGDTETAKFLQKALGYALTGDTSRECFFILYGATTRNGKGTSMETALYLLGDYGRTAQPESIAQKQNANGSNASEDIARLKGARFVNMSEPDKGLRLNAALVKQMTGGDTLTARYLHQNSFEFKPEFKLFINTNHLPKVADDSIFSSGRVKLIPFERHFEENEQDKGLKEFFRQPENISGIFNWFFEGLKLLEVEGLEQPEAVTNATNEYRENSDTIGLFINDCLEACGDNYIKIQQVYAEYSRWCEDFGYGAKNKSNFIEEINKKGMYKRHWKLGYVVYNYMLKKEFPFAT